MSRITEQLTEEEKQRVKDIAQARTHDNFEVLEDVTFRDYEDDDMAGTITKIVLKAHRDSVGVSAYGDIGILEVEKLENYKWELHLSPSGIRKLLREEEA